jgi:tetratricopeptide (TPR) repeat protein
MKKLEKALELTPKKQSLWFEYGATKIAAKDYEGALKAMKTAYDLEPSYNDAVMLYAITALYNNKTDLAGQLLGSLPRDVVLFDDRLIGVLVDRNNYMELVQIFTARIAEGRDEMQNNISLSISYLRLGEQGKAVEVLQKYIERHPEAKTDIEPYIEQIKAGKTF